MLSIQTIIPAYNDFFRAMRCANTLGDAVHIQDDTQHGPDWSLAIPHNITYARNKTQLGFAGNCNAAAIGKTADILFFVNQDIWQFPRNDWQAPLREAFADESVGIVGCKLLFPNGAIQHAGVVFDALRQPTHQYLGYTDNSYPRANKRQEVPAVTGAALAIRHSLFTALNGFDAARYPGGYFEDIDLCLRVKEAGYKIVYDPRLCFFHEVGTSGGNPSAFIPNALTFRRLWGDKIEPTLSHVTEDFWGQYVTK